MKNDRKNQDTARLEKELITDPAEIKLIIENVYKKLQEKGYNPINQLVGYFIADEPTYITDYLGARSEITRIDRDKALYLIVANYIETKLDIST